MIDIEAEAEATPTTAEVRDAYSEDHWYGEHEHNPESAKEFDRWLAAHDAEVVAAGQAAQQSITDAQVEAAARAEFEHVRARRPADHGPYSTWEQQDDEYREYCRRIARAGLEAALVAAIEGNTP